jgi:imidazolonepropionase-like amidohydrolase
MGNLIAQASILATFQKLTTAEVLAGITFRAAKALNLTDRGILKKGMKADFVVLKQIIFKIFCTIKEVWWQVKYILMEN